MDDLEELWPDNSNGDSGRVETSTISHGGDAPSDADASDSPSKDETMDIDPDGDGVEAFTAIYVRQADGAKVPQDDLFQAYATWTDQHDIDGTTRGWFTRKLRNVVNLETDRSRVDGDRVQFYIGLSLTEEGQTLLEQ